MPSKQTTPAKSTVAIPNDRPPVMLGNLQGPEGNVFCVLGRCERAASEAGWTEAQFNAFHAEATSGNYAHALATVREYFTTYRDGAPVREDEDVD